ncbi:AAA family ATPase [Frateuria hangzhouensis]|jgi:Cdc6-like AAA superfamily ATPase|uniref:AAA family ATPase n=1 Tax=Frateuria hangzhouensis TaxID=2995589 RepID=UPI002260E0F3|nr:AAA family ATPase [Frateuria sp. STR12]MCX7514216.1 AAA family ATPase [Frateuria sp. STR12]
MIKKEQQQLDKKDSAQIDRLRSELVQIARLGAKGDGERLRIQVLRLIRALRAEGDDLADVLQAAVFGRDEATTASAIRSVRGQGGTSLSVPVPTDGDSRLDLLRVEDPPVMPHPLVQSPNVIRRLDTLVAERRSASKLARANLQPSRAVLFTGPPGVGKTLAARHLALQLQLPLLVLDLASVISSFLGRTGNNIKQAFDFAKRRDCVFFLDELDAIAKRRDDDSDIGELKRLVTVLLQEIDLWGPNNLLVAATNHANLLDPAVWRRFDSTVEFPSPTADQLRELGELVSDKSDLVPREWRDALAMVGANSSQSDYIRDLNSLRRATLLGGKTNGRQVLTELLAARAPDLKLGDRKRLAVSLVKAGISQREASKLAKVARETLRSTL